MSHPQTLYVEEGSFLLSIESVATRLGCSPRTVMRLADRGELTRVRIGKLVRFRPEELEDLIVQHSENDGAPAGNRGSRKASDRGARLAT